MRDVTVTRHGRRHPSLEDLPFLATTDQLPDEHLHLPTILV